MILVPAADSDVGSFAREAGGARPAESAARRGDERDAPLQSEIHGGVTLPELGRIQRDMKPERFVFVCTNERPEGHPKGSCIGRGSAEILGLFRDLQGEKDLITFKVVATGCLEPCLAGPTVVVYPDNVWYG